MLVAPAESPDLLDNALRNAGLSPGSEWNGDLRVSPLADSVAGQIIAGSDEFEGLVGDYSESWTITGVSAAGELRGTITLDTVTRRGL